ncbi:hypothetical protein T484DRAFT_1783615 [Baffinella frigidus]|nr:hypothetical protein T484DRAFT_1783615 [Cryptophyta sp. CCMP2293]
MELTQEGTAPTVLPFDSTLDYSSFSVKIPEAELQNLPAIIAAFTPAQIEAKQQALSQAWPALTYQRRGGAMQSARLGGSASGGPGAGGGASGDAAPDAMELAFLELAKHAVPRGGTPRGFWT